VHCGGGAREQGTADGCPAYEGRDGTDDGADPGIPDGTTLHAGVWTCIERDVCCAEKGRQWIAHHP
jgi:hypothetical protein